MNLIDTNLLIYPFDARDPSKQARARQVLSALDAHASGAVSSQALSEFSSLMLRKLGLPAARVYGLVERFESIFPVLPLSGAVVLEAVRGVRDHAFAYFDAQVWASARLNQIGSVLSEDFAAGSRIEGVNFLNPLDPAFDLATLSS